MIAKGMFTFDGFAISLSDVVCVKSGGNEFGDSSYVVIRGVTQPLGINHEHANQLLQFLAKDDSILQATCESAWEMAINTGVTVDRLRTYLKQIPEDAKIVSIRDRGDNGLTVIEFERETSLDEPQ